VRAAYDGIYYDILSSIERGIYHYRDFLPSEGALTKKYGCAHNTVRKALSLLAEKGYVQAIHGKGVRVLYHSTPLLTSHIHAFEDDGFEPYGFDPLTAHEGEAVESKVLRMEFVDYDDEFAERTGFAREESCLLLERLHKVKGTPVEYELSYIRSDVVQGLGEEEATKPISEFVEEHGERFVTVKESFTIDNATLDDQQLLGVPEGSSIVVITQAFFDHEGLICKFSELRRIPSAFAYLHTRIRSKLA